MLSRREFLKASAYSTLALAGLAACESSTSNLGENITLEQLAGTITAEVDRSSIGSLREYGIASTADFINSAFGVYSKVVPGSSSPRELIDTVQFVGLNDMIRMMQESGMPISDYNNIPLARVMYANQEEQPDDSSRTILVNLDATSFNDGGNIGVLRLLTHAATHEPFHFDAVHGRIDKELTAISTFKYTHMYGFAVRGKNMQTGEITNSFDTFDELATRLLHRTYIAPILPFIEQNYKQWEIDLLRAFADNILMPLGIATEEELLQIQRDKKGGFLGILARFTDIAGGDENDGFRMLVEVDNALYNSTNGAIGQLDSNTWIHNSYTRRINPTAEAALDHM